MKVLALLTLLFGAYLPLAALAVDEPEIKPNMKEALKTLVLEDAKKLAAKPVPPPAATTPVKTAQPAAAAPIAPVATAAKEASAPKPADPAATLLPRVEVRQGRITELDLQVRQQEREIAREMKNTKSTDLDKALNNPEISHALSIFGGTSNEFRESVAKERISLMEAERDLMEEIAHAKTKEEKQELQSQLDDLKAIRRDLEKTMR